MSWADLESLLVARERPDGSVVLVARDVRPATELVASRPLSTIVAICRVCAGRHAIASKHGGRGVMVYAHAAPPAFLIDAVSAAGGVVYDGKTDRASRGALAATVQLDAAFVDLASAVRRRLGAKSFAGALDLLEAELRRAPQEPDARWIAALELVALAGELIRERRAARWEVAPGELPPLALELGAHRLLPGKLAVSIVDGGAGTMRSLAELEHRIAHSAPLGRAMPMIAPRGALPLDRMSWTPLLPEFARDDLPAIVWIEDLGGGLVEYPMGRGAPSAALIAQGLANLAAVPVELHDEQLGGTHVVVVADHPFAAEKLLDPATMRDVAARLGATGAQLLVAIPVRGMLLAIDALPALIDDARMTGFVRGAERMYQQASERDRISPEVFVYAYDRPLGLVGS